MTDEHLFIELKCVASKFGKLESKIASKTYKVEKPDKVALAGHLRTG